MIMSKCICTCTSIWNRARLCMHMCIWIVCCRKVCNLLIITSTYKVFEILRCVAGGACLSNPSFTRLVLPSSSQSYSFTLRVYWKLCRNRIKCSVHRQIHNQWQRVATINAAQSDRSDVMWKSRVSSTQICWFPLRLTNTNTNNSCVVSHMKYTSRGWPHRLVLTK